MDSGESLSVLLAQAAGSDPSQLQAWAHVALEKKREGDGMCTATPAHAWHWHLSAARSTRRALAWDWCVAHGAPRPCIGNAHCGASTRAC